MIIPDGPLYFRTSSGASINLDNWMAGRPVFLVFSGPTLADMNLELLRRPGVMTFGVNNSPAAFRPRLWTCADPPGRFSDSIWMDPTIIKFVPEPLAAQRLRIKRNGRFAPSLYRPCDMPSTFLFPRNSYFEPADFLVQNSVNWGGDAKTTDSVGVKGFPSVMLQAIRLAHAVGFRTLYLCGCDFKMEEGKAGYAFDQNRDRHAVNHNNRLYEAMTKRLAALAPYFEMSGFKVVNCTPGSALQVFPYTRISEAVAEATKDCPEIDARGWYETPLVPKPPADPVGFLRVAGE